jgi:hypothetical protein
MHVQYGKYVVRELHHKGGLTGHALVIHWVLHFMLWGMLMYAIALVWLIHPVAGSRARRGNSGHEIEPGVCCAARLGKSHAILGHQCQGRRESVVARCA